MKKKKLKSIKYSKRKKQGYRDVTVILPPLLATHVEDISNYHDLSRAAYIRQLIKSDMAGNNND